MLFQFAPTDVKTKNRIQDNYELGFKKLSKNLRPIFFGPELVDSGRPLPIDLTHFQPVFYEPLPADIEAILCAEIIVPDPDAVVPKNTGESTSNFEGSSVKKSRKEGPSTPGEHSAKVQRRPVPEEGIPYLIRHVHGNNAGIMRLIEGFITSFAEVPEIGCQVSKRQVERQIFAMAERCLRPEKYTHHCWYVRDDVLKKYNLTDLPIPNSIIQNSPAPKRGRKAKNDQAPGTPKVNVAATQNDPPTGTTSNEENVKKE